MIYSDFLLQHFYKTPHQGVLDDTHDDVFVSEVGAQANEEVLRLSVRIQDGQVVEARFLATGSVGLIAGAEFFCDFIEGKMLSSLRELSVSQIQSQLQLPNEKRHSVHLLIIAMNDCLSGFS